MVQNRGLGSIIEPPSDSQLEHIRSEINEDEEKLLHNEKLLRNWIDCQPHFPKNCEENFVRNFLRNSKHIIERSKRKLEHHLIVKNLYPEYYSNRSPSSIEITKVIDTVDMVIGPKLTDTGRRLFFFKLHDPDAANFDIVQTFKLFFMMYDLVLTDSNPVGGEIAIFDGTHFSANHLVKFLSPALKPLITILREAYVIRLKQIHIVNSTPVLDKLWTVLRPLLHSKVRNTIITHNSTQSLCDYFGADVLPSSYGGNCKGIPELKKDWQDILNDNEQWFIEQENVKITEKIPENIKSLLYFKEELGVEGSFRKLQID